MFKAIISKQKEAIKSLEMINARYKKYYPTLAMLGLGFLFFSVSGDAFADDATTVFDNIYTKWKELVTSGLGKTMCGIMFLYGAIKGFKEGLTWMTFTWLGGAITIAISPTLLEWAFKFGKGITG